MTTPGTPKDVPVVTVASPRTPHVSQVNVKRQKQMSQLARPALTRPTFAATKPQRVDADGFLMPQAKSKPAVSVVSNDQVNVEEMIMSLRDQLKQGASII